MLDKAAMTKSTSVIRNLVFEYHFLITNAYHPAATKISIKQIYTT